MDNISEQAAALAGLTDKQREVLSLVSEGMTSKEIARKLRISESAVNQRIEVIRQRLGGLPRTQIARIYRRMSTVLITVPTSNSITGKSIQLQSEPIKDQQPEPEGAEVSTASLPASNPFGSHPSNFFHLLDRAAFGSLSPLYKLALSFGIALAFLMIGILALALARSLAELLDAFHGR